MSLASFAMFTGGGVGTYLNGKVLTMWGFEPIFSIAGILILIAGASATLLLRSMTINASSAQLVESHSVQGHLQSVNAGRSKVQSWN